MGDGAAGDGRCRAVAYRTGQDSTLLLPAELTRSWDDCAACGQHCKANDEVPLLEEHCLHCRSVVVEVAPAKRSAT